MDTGSESQTVIRDEYVRLSSDSVRMYYSSPAGTNWIKSNPTITPIGSLFFKVLLPKSLSFRTQRVKISAARIYDQ